MAMTHASSAGGAPSGRPAPHEMAINLHDDLNTLYIDFTIASDFLKALDARLDGGDDDFEQLLHMTWLNTRAASDRLMVLEEQAAVLVAELKDARS